MERQLCSFVKWANLGNTAECRGLVAVFIRANKRDMGDYILTVDGQRQDDIFQKIEKYNAETHIALKKEYMVRVLQGKHPDTDEYSMRDKISFIRALKHHPDKDISEGYSLLNIGRKLLGGSLKIAGYV